MATRLSNKHKPKKFEIECKKTWQLLDLEPGAREYIALNMETPIAFLNHLGTGGGGKHGLIDGIARCIAGLTVNLEDNPYLATPATDWEGPINIELDGKGPEDCQVARAFKALEEEHKAKLEAHKARIKKILGPAPVLEFRTTPMMGWGELAMEVDAEGKRTLTGIRKPPRKSREHRYTVTASDGDAREPLMQVRLTRVLRKNLAWMLHHDQRVESVHAHVINNYLQPLLQAGYDGRDQYYLWWDYLAQVVPKIQQALDPLWMEYNYVELDQWRRQVRGGPVVADPETGAVRQVKRGEAEGFVTAVGDGRDGWDAIPAPVFEVRLDMAPPRSVKPGALYDNGIRTFGVFRTRALMKMMHDSIVEAASGPEGFNKVGTAAIMLAGETMNALIWDCGARDYVGSLVKLREQLPGVMHMPWVGL